MATENAVTVIYDKTFETPKGSLRLYVDVFDLVDSISNYSEKLMLSRGIPFDLENLSPTDPMLIQASQILSWVDDPAKVLQLTKSHYERLASRVKTDAAILASTKKNPAYLFEPEPYPERETTEEWDVDLPEPVRNLRNPLERRLKQIFDILASSPSVMTEFYATMQTIYVEVERRARALGTDADGFRA